jgi:hypothetical protein
MPTYEDIPDGAAAAALASWRLTQKLTAFLIENNFLPAGHAVAMIRDAARSEQGAMDETWAPENEAAAHLLELLAKALERKHLGK